MLLTLTNSYPSLTNTDLERFQKRRKIILPDEYLSFTKKHNGGEVVGEASFETYVPYITSELQRESQIDSLRELFWIGDFRAILYAVYGS